MSWYKKIYMFAFGRKAKLEPWYMIHGKNAISLNKNYNFFCTGTTS